MELKETIWRQLYQEHGTPKASTQKSESTAIKQSFDWLCLIYSDLLSPHWHLQFATHVHLRLTDLDQ